MENLIEYFRKWNTFWSHFFVKMIKYSYKITKSFKIESFFWMSWKEVIFIVCHYFTCLHFQMTFLDCLDPISCSNFPFIRENTLENPNNRLIFHYRKRKQKHSRFHYFDSLSLLCFSHPLILTRWIRKIVFYLFQLQIPQK